MENLSFGAAPSEKDYRDIKDYQVTLATPYPTSFTDDLSEIAVTMQGKLGICTANLCYVIERQLAKKGIKVKLSRRFLYTVTKRLIDQNTSEGSSMRSALKAAYKYGVALESSVPTDVTVSHEKFIEDYTFTPEIWQEALKYRIGGYISIGTDKDSLAAGISQYGALYARFEVGNEWFTPSWNAKDILPLRKPAKVISGHAVVPFSYDSSFPKMHAILRNSWSTDWANKGNGDFFIEDYGPTEAWAVTMNPIVNELPKEEEFSHVFNTNMELGDTNEEVKKLQTFLKINGYFDYPSATGFFGRVTQDALYHFQLDHVYMNWIEKYLYRGRYCGLKTRTVINSILSK